MFKIPKDLERKTSEKFKNVDVQKLINFLFQEILLNHLIILKMVCKAFLII